MITFEDIIGEKQGKVLRQLQDYIGVPDEQLELLPDLVRPPDTNAEEASSILGALYNLSRYLLSPMR